MKRKILTLLALIMLLMAVLPSTQAETFTPDSAVSSPFEGVTINVFNWGLFINEELLEEFTAETGIEVIYSYFDSNEAMYTQLRLEGVQYDVIIPSDYKIEQLIYEGLLRQLNFDNIPNFEHIDNMFRNPAYDPQNLYSVPYAWGVTGIIYNSNYVDTPTSWDVLWDEQFADRILMFDNPRDAFGLAALLLGDDINDKSEETMNRQGEKLREQRPLVQQYVMDQVYSLMPSGEAWLAPWYVGSFFHMYSENKSLRFAIPEEGVNFFVDAMVIPYNSRNPEAAEAFINFFTRPDVSGRNVNYFGYSTPITAAREFHEFENMEHFALAYPDYEWLAANTQMFAFESVDATNRQVEEFMRIQTSTGSGDRSLLAYYIGVPVVVVILLGLYLGMKMSKKKRDAAID